MPLGQPAGLGPDRPLCSCEQGHCVTRGPFVPKSAVPALVCSALVTSQPYTRSPLLPRGVDPPVFDLLPPLLQELRGVLRVTLWGSGYRGEAGLLGPVSSAFCLVFSQRECTRVVRTSANSLEGWSVRLQLPSAPPPSPV